MKVFLENWQITVIGLGIVLLLWVMRWARNNPEKVENSKLLFPIRFYLQSVSFRRWTVNILGAVLILWFANFFMNWIKPALTPADLFPPPFSGGVAVKAQIVERGPVVNIASYTGVVEPFESNDVISRVDGFVEELYVYEGDYVKKGQVLARLDVSEILPPLQKAIADSTFKSAELKRAKQLYEDSVITASDYDLALNMYQQAVAHVELMKSIVDYAVIKAGTSGFVAERLIYPGQYVKTGTKLLRIDKLDKIRIKFKVGENDLPFIQPGNPVWLEFPQMTTLAFKQFSDWEKRIQVSHNNVIFASLVGKNISVNFQGDSVSVSNYPNPVTGIPGMLAQVAVVFPTEDPATRTGVVEVRITNPSFLIKSNAYVAGKFAVARIDNVIRVPSRAIVQMPNGRSAVYLAPAFSDQGNTEIREVVPGLNSSDYTQIVEGIEENEYVLYSGMKDLSNGQQVTVIERNGEPQ